MFNSTTLAGLLQTRQSRQALLLRSYTQRMPELLQLRVQDGHWQPLPRRSDPDERADEFNRRHLHCAPSQLVPGLLGLYASRAAYPPGHDKVGAGAPNLGYYGGWLMVMSEYLEFQQRYGLSTGIQVAGLHGRRDDGAKTETVMLVGDPLNPVVQALHSDDRQKVNCRLATRTQPAGSPQLISASVGRNGLGIKHDAVVLQANKVVRQGDELCVSYSNQNWRSSPKSCCCCCRAVQAIDRRMSVDHNDNGGRDGDGDESDNDNDTQELVGAFRCEGFIAGSACPFYVHYACTEQPWASDQTYGVPAYDAPYCPFCFSLSTADTLPSSQLHVQQDNCSIRSDAAFATVRQRAAQLGWSVLQAAVVSRLQPAAMVQYVCKPDPPQLQQPRSHFQLSEPLGRTITASTSPALSSAADAAAADAAAAMTDVSSASEASAVPCALLEPRPATGSQAEQAGSQADSEPAALDSGETGSELTLDSSLSAPAPSISQLSASSGLSDDFYLPVQ